eukprot:5383467-Amphidinium_carterae.1
MPEQDTLSVVTARRTCLALKYTARRTCLALKYAHLNLHEVCPQATRHDCCQHSRILGHGVRTYKRGSSMICTYQLTSASANLPSEETADLFLGLGHRTCTPQSTYLCTKSERAEQRVR